ncbi:hypothetical protein ACX80W_01515 [Arthrobacter sp. TMN-37]
MLTHPVESREEDTVTGFLELMCLDDDLLEAEFQELVDRIDPPPRTRGVAAPARRRHPDAGPRRGTVRSLRLRRNASRTPPPARERSPPAPLHLRVLSPTRTAQLPPAPRLTAGPAVPPN